MIIANNATFNSFVSNYHNATSKLQTAMAKLSSGKAFNQPGDAPADLGISERFQAQIASAGAASSVIQNGVNLMQTTDTWLQQINDIMNRMSELAVSASDGSKSQADRTNLDLEFQQLKSEVGRIAEAGKYNGLQTNAKTAVATYDTQAHQIVFMQPDGSDKQTLPLDLKAGNAAANGIAYSFESSAQNGSIGDFMFTDNGKSIVYVAQKSTGALSARKTLMKLDIATNTLTTVALASAGGASATTQARLAMDNQGRIWVSNPSTAGVGKSHYNINLLDTNTMKLDAGGALSTNAWAGGVSTASGFSNFAVNGNYIYYMARSGGTGNLQYIKQNMNDNTDKQVLLSNLSGSSYNLKLGNNYAISADGQYIAYEDPTAATGTMGVINTQTGQATTQSVGVRGNSIADLGFDANGRLYWTDTGSDKDANAIKTAQIAVSALPSLTNIKIIDQANHGQLGSYNSGMAALGMGLSVGGGSPASNYTFQIGPDQGMAVSFSSADVRLTKLGISTLNVADIADAQAAVTALASATDFVANQRAILGSQVSRLNFLYAANQGYQDNISQANSRISDVDIAQQTTLMTQAQVQSQTSISVMAQANASRQNILRLLQ